VEVCGIYSPLGVSGAGGVWPGLVGDYEGVGSHYDSFSIKPKYSTLGYILWSIVWFC